MRLLSVFLTILGLTASIPGQGFAAELSSQEGSSARSDFVPQPARRFDPEPQKNKPWLTAGLGRKLEEARANSPAFESTGQNGGTRPRTRPHSGLQGLGSFYGAGEPRGPQFNSPSASLAHLNRAGSGKTAAAQSHAVTTTVAQRRNQPVAPLILKPSSLPSQAPTRPAPAIISGATIPATHPGAVINGTGFKHRP